MGHQQLFVTALVTYPHLPLPVNQGKDKCFENPGKLSRKQAKLIVFSFKFKTMHLQNNKIPLMVSPTQQTLSNGAPGVHGEKWKHGNPSAIMAQ